MPATDPCVENFQGIYLRSGASSAQRTLRPQMLSTPRSFIRIANQCWRRGGSWKWLGDRLLWHKQRIRAYSQTARPLLPQRNWRLGKSNQWKCGSVDLGETPTRPTPIVRSWNQRNMYKRVQLSGQVNEETSEELAQKIERLNWFVWKDWRIKKRSILY